MPPSFVVAPPDRGFDNQCLVRPFFFVANAAMTQIIMAMTEAEDFADATARKDMSNASTCVHT